MVATGDDLPGPDGRAIFSSVLDSEYSNSKPRNYRYGNETRALLIGVAVFCGVPFQSNAADLLVADRLSNSVYRYSAAGALLGTVIDNSADLNQPTGIGMSPDFTELYVSSSQNNRVMKYDYDAATGAATNPTIFADASDGLAFPNDIQFGPDGKIYVANLSGGVSRFNVDGSSAGAKLALPGNVQTASINFTSDGKLLAGAFQSGNQTRGGVAISDTPISAFSPTLLVNYAPAINGATGLMIHDDHLYVSGLYAGNIRRFALATGQMDASWGISGLGFPQDLAAAPDGNGFLAGILGVFNGTGNITRYAYNGTLLGTFAVPSEHGFTEATAFVAVPTPSSGGDFNGDGIVDAADYVMWRKASPTNESGYDDWQANFGESEAASSAPPGANPVPEPVAVMLLFIAVLSCSLVRHRS
jgi:sugar lactone lactonase YvrE